MTARHLFTRTQDGVRTAVFALSDRRIAVPVGDLWALAHQCQVVDLALQTNEHDLARPNHHAEADAL